MITKPNISYTTKHNLCTGCGVCEGTCPTKSITMGVKRGLFVPNVDNNTCINHKGCHKCYDACPGIGVKLNEISDNCFPDSSKDKYVGNYQKCFTGYSNDYEIRVLARNNRAH